MENAPSDSIFKTKLAGIDKRAADLLFPAGDIRKAIERARGSGMAMRNVDRPEAGSSYARVGRACLAFILTSEHIGARHAPEQEVRARYRDLILEIQFCARTIAENADAITTMAVADPTQPDQGMINALELMGRSLYTGFAPGAFDAMVLNEATTVRLLTDSHSFKSASNPLGPLAHLHDVAARVVEGLNEEFASRGPAGNRPDRDLRDFLIEIVSGYRDIVMPKRLSAAPSQGRKGLASSPLGRFVEALFDTMEMPNRHPIPLPQGLRPSASALRKIVDRMNECDRD